MSDEPKIRDAIFRGLIADGSFTEDGIELMPLGDNEILLNIGNFNMVQEIPQKFIITVKESK